MQLEFFEEAGEVAASCHVLRVGERPEVFVGPDVSAEVSRPGLRLDLGSPADVRG